MRQREQWRNKPPLRALGGHRVNAACGSQDRHPDCGLSGAGGGAQAEVTPPWAVMAWPSPSGCSRTAQQTEDGAVHVNLMWACNGCVGPFVLSNHSCLIRGSSPVTWLLAWLRVPGQPEARVSPLGAVGPSFLVHPPRPPRFLPAGIFQRTRRWQGGSGSLTPPGKCSRLWFP